MKYKVHFIDLEDLQKFVTAVTALSCDVNLYDNHKCLDAKSIIALMNLDMRKSFWVEFMTDDEKLLLNCQKAVKDILV